MCATDGCWPNQLSQAERENLKRRCFRTSFLRSFTEKRTQEKVEKSLFILVYLKKSMSLKKKQFQFEFQVVVICKNFLKVDLVEFLSQPKVFFHSRTLVNENLDQGERVKIMGKVVFPTKMPNEFTGESEDVETGLISVENALEIPEDFEKQTFDCS